MDIIRAGIGISKTIRNVSRFREIVLVFAKHGFDEFVTGGATSIIPNFVLPKSKVKIREELKNREVKDWGQVVGARLRLCFEDLGPAFVKFGQLLSSREDLFDPSFIEEMKKLRDQVKPMMFSEVREQVEASLGRKVGEVFESIEEKPIGTASIGVVYTAKLKTGEKVVVKVRRPHIDKVLENDFSILLFLAVQAEKVSEDIKFLGVSRALKDFEGSLYSELDFNIEAMNAVRIKRNLEAHEGAEIFYIPKVYNEYTAEDILVMELLEGIPFSDQKAIQPHIKELAPKLDTSVRIFLKTFLQDGFFHADLHGGNFFYLKNEQIGLIDFGLVGTLSPKNRKNFIALVYSLITFNYENLVYEFLDVAEYEKVPDVDVLIRDLRDALSPFIGLTVQQTNFSLVLQLVIKTLRDHELFLPREWFIVFRALATLDGVGKSLGIDFDIYSIMEEDIKGIVQNSFSKEEFLEEAIWSAKDMLSVGRMIPRHIKWVLKDWSRKGYAVEIIHKGHENSVSSLSKAIAFLGYAFLTGVFVFSGVLLLGGTGITEWRQIPMSSWLFWGIGLAVYGKGWMLFNRRKKS